MPTTPPPEWITQLEDEAIASMRPFGGDMTGDHPELRKGNEQVTTCAQCAHKHHPTWTCRGTGTTREGCGCPSPTYAVPQGWTL